MRARGTERGAAIWGARQRRLLVRQHRVQESDGVPMIVFNRFLAFIIDCALIVIYLVMLRAVISIIGFDFDDLDRPSTYLAIFMIVTIPVIGFFASCESVAGRTPGKAIVGLGVRFNRTETAGLALVRNTVKFLPWEVAHLGVWIIPGRPLVDPPEAVSLWLWSGAIGMQIIQAALVSTTGRTIHDRFAGSRVAFGQGQGLPYEPDRYD